MSNKSDDGANLLFDFTNMHSISEPMTIGGNSSPHGTYCVDFYVETENCMYFIEVKDFQNPEAAENRRIEDFEMLIAAGKKKSSDTDELSSIKGTFFCFRIGQKIKDSLLCKYATGAKLSKSIIYLIFINLDNLGKSERGRLKEKIRGHIPTGLYSNKYSSFPSITFDVVDKEQLNEYGIICTSKS